MFSRRDPGLNIPGLRSEFVRHVATLVAGRTGAMLISFLLIPVISRLFTPEHFGSAAFFAAIVMVLGGVCSLKYPRAAILPKDEAIAEDLLVLSMQLLNVFTVLMYVGLVAMLLFAGSLPLFDILNVWVWLLPLGVWLFGATEVMVVASNREKAYRTISASDIGQALTTSGGRIGAGVVFGSSIGGLVLSYLGGYVVRAAMLRTRMGGIAYLVWRWPDWRSLAYRAREYKDFPFFDTPANLAMSLSTKLPIFAMGLMYSPVIAGFYAMAERLVKIPIQTMGNSIRMVFLRKIAGYRADGKPVAGSFWKVVGVMAVSGVLPVLAMWFAGEEIVVIVLGDKWRSAGHYTEILAPWFYQVWVTVMVPSVMIAFRRQSLWAGIQISAGLVRAVVFGVAYGLAWEPEAALSAFAWVNVSIGLIMLLLAGRVVKHGDKADLRLLNG